MTLRHESRTEVTSNKTRAANDSDRLCWRGIWGIAHAWEIGEMHCGLSFAGLLTKRLTGNERKRCEYGPSIAVAVSRSSEDALSHS